MESYHEYEVQIKMFGPMQLENQSGVVKEPGRESEAWKILKFLLANRGKSFEQEVMQELIWPGSVETDNAYFTFRARLSRMRGALKDINLGGKNGLLLCDDSLLDLNPEYDIQTDTDYFDILIQRIKDTPADDREGLALCSEALTLYRGDYLGKTQGAWLEERRVHYRELFDYLIQTTLVRTKLLQDASALMILSSRTAAIMPEDETLRNEILHVAASIKRPFESDIPEKRPVDRPKKVINIRPTAEKNINDAENGVRVRIFGTVELENQFGRIGEEYGQQSQSWLMLKYLIANQGREVTYTELMNQIWADSRIDTEGNRDGAARVYLSRMRRELKPLHLDGENGLIFYSAGYYNLNPKFELNTDADLFLILMNQIRNTPLDDPNGLVLCVEALELFRGKVMENTQTSSWLELSREKYKGEFCFLACNTVERMETLNDCTAIGLLSQRALSIVPEEADLHWEILDFMAKQNLEEELTRYVMKWASTAPSLQEVSREGETPEFDWTSTEKENTIAVSMFGAMVLRNQYGCIEEDPKQPSEVWAFLKYLLANRDRAIPENELAQALLSDASAYNVKNTFDVRWRRLRKLLEPMQLGGTDGLILHESGAYRVNSIYEIQPDENVFQSLMKTIRETTEEDPEGLHACKKALELYRGEFLQNSKIPAWVIQWRKHYYEEFCYLVHTTFRRMTFMGSAEAVGLLGRRVASFMPDAKELHAQLISYMAKQNRQAELEEFVSRLVLHNK